MLLPIIIIIIIIIIASRSRSRSSSSSSSSSSSGSIKLLHNSECSKNKNYNTLKILGPCRPLSYTPQFSISQRLPSSQICQIDLYRRSTLSNEAKEKLASIQVI